MCAFFFCLLPTPLVMTSLIWNVMAGVCVFVESGGGLREREASLLRLSVYECGCV